MVLLPVRPVGLGVLVVPLFLWLLLPRTGAHVLAELHLRPRVPRVPPLLFGQPLQQWFLDVPRPAGTDQKVVPPLGVALFLRLVFVALLPSPRCPYGHPQFAAGQVGAPRPECNESPREVIGVVPLLPPVRVVRGLEPPPAP